MSIVIPTKNSAKYLYKVLRSVDKQTYETTEIIVVDNYSADKTVEVAKKWGARVYTQGPERSVQKNFGVAKAKGKYVLMLDSDCELEKGVLSECVALCEDGLDGVMIPLRHKGEGFWTKSKNLERICYDGDDDLESPWFVRRGAFRKIRGFDEGLVAGEDWDLSYRLRKAGYKLARNKSVMHHNLGRYTVKEALIGKYYYGKRLVLYLSKGHKNVGKQLPFFRKAYLKNWWRLLAHPFLTFGFMYLKFVESVAVVVGIFHESVVGEIVNWQEVSDFLLGKKGFSDNLLPVDKVWLKFLKKLSHNRVLYSYSKKVLAQGPKLDKEKKQDLRKIVREGERRMKQFEKTVKFLNKNLKAKGIPYLVVKTFKYIDYVTFDVDVLVPYEKFYEAQELLEKGGCRILPHPRKQGLHQRNCVKKGLLNIDLHRNFYWLGIEHVDLNFVWKKPRRRKINGVMCSCPSLEVDFLLHNKQLAYERYYVTLLDYLAVTEGRVDMDFSKIRRQVKKYRWEYSYYVLMHVLDEIENSLDSVSLPYMYPLKNVFEQLLEVLMHNRKVLFADFGYYCFTFMRYFLSGKRRMPYYDHWFDFSLLEK